MPMPTQKVAELRAFVEMLDSDPTLLQLPELAFFKNFMTKHGATLPTAKPSAAGASPSENPKSDAQQTNTNSSSNPPPPKDESESEEEEEETAALPEYPVFEEDPAHVAAESHDAPAPPNTTEKEFTDEECEKMGQLKQEATDAMQDGDLEKALSKYSEVMAMGNSSALLCSRRAEVLLKMRRPMSAIKDCDVALQLNPDSGKAYKMRGKAYRMLGKWKEAHRDLDQGQKIDYDEDTYEIQKFVSERSSKIEEYERTVARITEEQEKKKKMKDIKRRRKEAQREYERQKKEEEEDDGGFNMPGGFPGGMGGMPGGMGGMPGGMGGMPGGMGGMPGGMGGMPGGMGGMGGMGGAGGMPGGLGGMFSGLMSDPEMKKIFENPKMMQAVQDIMSNPGNLAKYKDDPEVMAAFKKLTSQFGGSGMEM